MKTIGRMLVILWAAALLPGCDGEYIEYAKKFQLQSTIEVRADQPFSRTRIVDFADLAEAVDQIPDNAEILSVYLTSLDVGGSLLATTSLDSLQFSVFLQDLKAGTAAVEITKLVKVGPDKLALLQTAQFAGYDIPIGTFLGSAIAPALESLRTQINGMLSGGAVPSYLIRIQGTTFGGRIDMNLTVKIDFSVRYLVCEELPAEILAIEGGGECTVS